MNPSPKYLFDECLGKPAMELLQQRLDPSPTFAHLMEFVESGSPDSKWIPKIAREGGWVLITADQGKKSTRDEKLPIICRESKLTHVMLSKAIHHCKSSLKIAILEIMWPQILATSAAPAGTGYQLRRHGFRGDAGFAVALERVERQSGR